MNIKELIRNLEIQLKEFEKKTYYTGETRIDLMIKDVLSVLQTQQAELEENKKALDIFDEREYRKRYLEEERAKRPNLLYPDADEIYQRYFEQRAELEKKQEEIEDCKKCVIRDDIHNYIEEIEKQSKIINIMAEQLTTDIHSKEWVIDYYEREVKEDK